MEVFEVLTHSDIWEEEATSNTRPKKQSSREAAASVRQLRKAVLRGDVGRVEALLRAQTWSDRSLLAALKCVRSAEVAVALANASPDFFRGGGGAEALFSAVKAGRVDAVRSLLTAGVPADAAPSWNRDDVSALHLASARGSADSVTALLAAGADINAMTQGIQALHLAAYYGNKDCVVSLVDGGALIEETDGDGWRALHHAAGNGYVDCVRVLLDRGANVDVPGQYGSTALLLAARAYVSVYIPYGIYSHSSRVKEEYAECVELLLQRGANANLTDEDGGSPLATALTNNCHESIKSLIAAGADIWYINNSGENLLHGAASCGGNNPEYLPFIAELGLDVNAKANDGSTPLHNAVRACYDETVKTLLQLGANVDLQDNEGFTPLHQAAAFEDTTVLTILLDAGANVNCPALDGSTAIHCAARSSHPSLKILLERGADVNARTGDGRTVIHFAATGWQIECFETIRALGLDLQVVDEHGWTPLHHAVSAGQMETMRWLLNHGFTLSCRASDGSTPLHVAAGEGSTWMVKELLALRAPLRAVDAQGRTALHKASLGSDEDLVRTLLLGGVVREARDVNGDTAAQLATLPEIRRIIQRWALAA